MIKEYEQAKEKHLGEPNSLKVRNLAMVGNATLRHTQQVWKIYNVFVYFGAEISF